MAMADLSSENRFLGGLAPRTAVVAGIGGLAILAFGALVTQTAEPARVEVGLGPWERFLRAYIVAFCVVLSLSLGGLWFVMLQHLTKAGWSVVLRRVAEAFASNLTWLWIFFIPILIGVFKTDLYAWRHPDPADKVLAHKALFFEPWFWIGRTVFYFAIWAFLARYFLRRSVNQDETGDPAITLRMQKVAAPGMILYAFTQTFAIIDWVMSLEPHWFSTMFGVYFFAASCCGFFAATILACMAMQRAGRLKGVITTEHYHDLGKGLFAFGIVFWAYIAYSQYMLIWYANIPEETMWFIARQLGGWQSLSIFLVLGHFLGPFLILISRWPKRWRGFLAIGAAWMLFVHFIDIFWLVMPAVPGELIATAASYEQLVATFRTGLDPVTGMTFNELYGLHWRIVDVACLLGMAGLFIGGTAWGLREKSLVPVRDPRLGESLAFENF
jgi:hypothetical protein